MPSAGSGLLPVLAISGSQALHCISYQACYYWFSPPVLCPCSRGFLFFGTSLVFVLLPPIPCSAFLYGQRAFVQEPLRVLPPAWFAQFAHDLVVEVADSASWAAATVVPPAAFGRRG